MDNYNYKLDIYTSNSNSEIIKRMDSDTYVLEFGPAYGRLTEYLQVSMKCKVDIVELDENAGKEAKKFSNKSCIGSFEGDIESYNWESAFEGNLYDYIIFADILEHLKDPMLVLKKCQKYLKSNGSILCSVPNIAHSSIIISLMNDDFKYKNNGLLDSTHLRFFTRSTFRDLCEQCGYQIIYETAIRSEVGKNEIPYTYESVEENFRNALRLRRNGEAYQYIFELKKSDDENQNCEEIHSLVSTGWIANCYIMEQGESIYDKRNGIRQTLHQLDNELYFDLSDFGHIKGIIVEPINTVCILNLMRLTLGRLNGEEIAVSSISTNGLELSKKSYIFSDNFPQIYVTLENEDMRYLFIKYEVFLPGNSAISKLKDLFLNQKKDSKQLYSMYEKMRDTNHALEEELKQIVQNKVRLELEMKQMKQTASSLAVEKESLENENKEISERILLLNHENIKIKAENLILINENKKHESLVWNRLYKKIKREKKGE